MGRLARVLRRRAATGSAGRGATVIPPPFFTLTPGLDFAALPFDAVFECVYAPEATSKQGWRVVVFRVVRAWNPAVKAWQRCYEVQTTRAVSEAEAAGLWAAREVKAAEGV